MPARIDARLVYGALSLALVAMAIALSIYTYDNASFFPGRTWFTLSQSLPVVAFAGLPLVLALSSYRWRWPNFADRVATFVVVLLFLGSAYLAIKAFDLPAQIDNSRATTTYLSTAIRTFGCTLALATLLANGSTTLARIPTNVYRASAVLVLLGGAGTELWFASSVDNYPVAVFFAGFLPQMMLGCLALLWTEARDHLGAASGYIERLGIAAGAFSIVSGVYVGYQFVSASPADDFWMFLYGLLPSLVSGLCILVATRMIFGRKSSPALLGCGRLVGVSAVILGACLAYWFTYSFLPEAPGEGWRFARAVEGFVTLGLLLAVQFEVLQGPEEPWTESSTARALRSGAVLVS